jgi:hypothetical protein
MCVEKCVRRCTRKENDIVVTLFFSFLLVDALAFILRFFLKSIVCCCLLLKTTLLFVMCSCMSQRKDSGWFGLPLCFPFPHHLCSYADIFLLKTTPDTSQMCGTPWTSRTLSQTRGIYVDYDDKIERSFFLLQCIPAPFFLI